MNRLFVISGASGVGKSTVLQYVMDADKSLSFSVSATTRSPRPNEIDGVHYYFVTREKFDSMVEGCEFLEYDCHMGNCYGTPAAQVDEKLKNGSVILDIDPNGALNVKKARPDAKLIFIVPPSPEELEKRLRGRGDTSEEQMQMRLARVEWELEQSKKYDYTVINDRAEACADEILNIIAHECAENGGM